MRKSTVLAAFLIGLGVTANARTWTSSDGSKTFEAELRSYDSAAGTVSVVNDKGQLVRFSASMLSEADQAFLKEQEATKPSMAEDPSASLASQVVGQKISKAKLHKLDGRRYRRAEIEKAPEYYILYYSASW